MSIIILLILIYVVTLILFGITFYLDMDKGESLEHYFNGLDTLDVVMFFVPLLNIIILIVIIFYLLINHLWDKIKHWEK